MFRRFWRGGSEEFGVLEYSASTTGAHAVAESSVDTVSWSVVGPVGDWLTGAVLSAACNLGPFNHASDKLPAVRNVAGVNMLL